MCSGHMMNSVLIFVAFCLQSADAFFGPTLFPLPSCCSVPAKGSSLQMRVQSTSAISKKNILAGAALLSFAVSPAQPSRALQLNTAAGGVESAMHASDRMVVALGKAKAPEPEGVEKVKTEMKAFLNMVEKEISTVDKKLTAEEKGMILVAGMSAFVATPIFVTSYRDKRAIERLMGSGQKPKQPKVSQNEDQIDQIDFLSKLEQVRTASTKTIEDRLRG